MALTYEQQGPIDVSLVGVGLIIVPPRATTTNIPWEGGIEVQRAPDASGAPGTWGTIALLDHVPPAGGRYIDLRPWTTAIWWYRYRPIRAGALGSFSAAVSATAGLFPRGTRAGWQGGDAAAFYAGVRGDPLSDGKYALMASDAAGGTADAGVKLVPSVGVLEGGVVHRLYRHREEIVVNGADADGDTAVTFAQTYQNAPLVFFRGGQYVSFSNVLGTGLKQRLRMQPINVTSSGFISRAQIVAPGTPTAQTDDFASGNVIDAAGETAEVNLSPGGANDDTYSVHYFVEVTVNRGDAPDASATLVLAIETNDGGGGGWVERATYIYSAFVESPSSSTTTTETHEIKQIVVTGLGTDDDIRLRAKSFTVEPGSVPGVDPSGSFICRGGDAGGSNPETYNGVTYTTATDTVESAIPAAGDNVTWVAQEVV